MLAFFLLFFKVRLLKVLLAVILVYLTIYDWQEIPSAGGLAFTRNNIGWISLCLVGSWGLYNQYKRGKALLIPKFWLVGLAGVIIATSSFWLADTTFLSNGLWLPVGLFAAWVFVLLIYNSTLSLHKPEWLILILLSVCFAQVLLGLWQVFHGFMLQYTGDLPSYKLTKITGTFNQRNLYASFVATGVACAVYLFSYKEETIIGKFVIPSNVLNKVLLVFTGLATFTLLLTDSRIGIYSCALSLFLILIAKYRKPKEIIKPTLSIAIGFICAQVIVATVYESQTKDFSNTSSRQLMYEVSYEAVKDKVIFGHGLGSFEKVYIEKLGYLAEKGHVNSSELKGRPQNLTHPHNELLYWGVQGGLVSIFGLLILAGSIIALLSKEGLIQLLKYSALLIPTALHLMVEFPFYISLLHLIIAIFILAYITVKIPSKKDYSLTLQGTRVTSKIMIVLMMFVTIILGANAYSLNQASTFEYALNKDTEKLSNVALTLGWSDSFQALKLKYEANVAARHNVLEPQVAYLDWLERQVMVTPRLNYYFHLFSIYKVLEKEREANEVFHTIMYLYKGVGEAEAWLDSQKKQDTLNPD